MRRLLVILVLLSLGAGVLFAEDAPRWTPKPLSSDLAKEADSLAREIQQITIERAKLAAHQATVNVRQQEFLARVQAAQGAPVTTIFDWTTLMLKTPSSSGPARPDAR